ncbi:hypothetical protein OAH77_04380 [Flavobacteriaceae bacterium]|nr:hypothetical protein [Flavobacteriaceae bacterium]
MKYILVTVILVTFGIQTYADNVVIRKSSLTCYTKENNEYKKVCRVYEDAVVSFKISNVGFSCVVHRLGISVAIESSFKPLECKGRDVYYAPGAEDGNQSFMIDKKNNCTFFYKNYAYSMRMSDLEIKKIAFYLEAITEEDL